MQELVIQKTQGKGRAFHATMLAHVVANTLWAGGQAATDTVRPVWMMLAGSDAELGPFVANLQTGRKAECGLGRKPDRYEVLRSSGFQWAWQRTSHGSVVTCFLPELFRLDPGMVDPKGVAFCLLPAQDWLVAPDPAAAKHLAKLGAKPDEIERVLPLAPIFIAFLDRRTRCPLVPDPRFYAQVLYAAFTYKLASWSVSDRNYYNEERWGLNKGFLFKEYDTPTVGLSEGLVFKASHVDLEAFLANQVRVYFDEVGRG